MPMPRIGFGRGSGTPSARPRGLPRDDGSPSIVTVKCPRCGFLAAFPNDDDEIECPKCGALLTRKDRKGDKVIREPDEITHTEADAEELWREDHPDY